MKSCLVVDDSRAIRSIMKSMVLKLGYSVAEAADGRQALEACAAAYPDLILLDWNMPVMNGLEFLKALRARPGGAAPIVIFCTTENSLAHIREGIGAGANEYIMKPFDQDILETKLAQVGLL